MSTATSTTAQELHLRHLQDRRDRNCNSLHVRTTTRKRHDQHNRDVDHFVRKKQENLYGLPSHGDPTLRHDRDVDNLVDELQLRNETRHLSLHTTGM